MTSRLVGTQVHVVLPVVLSEDARRQALVATGREPYRVQPFEVPDLTELDSGARERVIDVKERVRVATPDADGPETQLRVTRYEQLHYSEHNGWVLAGSNALVQVFFPGRGTTRTLYGALRQELKDAHALDAMWSRAPLLEHLGEDGEVLLDDVLDAYEEACRTARHAADLARRGQTHDTWKTGISMSDGLIVFTPRPNQEDTLTIALVRESDPEAFESAAELIEEVLDSGDKEVATRLADEACNNAFVYAPHLETDRQLVADAVKPAVEKIREEQRQRQTKIERDLAYTHERERWIAERGSTRLKRAATRGYRHDGAYRDERLESEIPGFVGSLGKDVEIREILNPTADALDAEAEVLEQVEKHQMADVDVRLVWVVAPFSSHGTGEYVQLSNYLGRHTVYRAVQPATDDDIPF